MGFVRSTYVVYGVRIPVPDGTQLWSYTHQLDKQLAGTGVNHLEAGDYDRDMLFLCIGDDGMESNEVEVGKYLRLSVENPEDIARLDRWDELLTQALAVLGVTPEEPFGWLVVPDVS